VDPLDLWGQFVELYNGNPVVEALSIALFWFGLYIIFVRVFHFIKASKTVPHKIQLELDQLRAENQQFKSSCSEVYWKEKKDLYDRLRRSAQSLNAVAFASLDAEFFMHISRLGIPASDAINWDETHEWESFFRTVGDRITEELFKDIDNNGFEEIGAHEKATGKEVTTYVEGKVAYIRSLIQQALITALQRQSFYRKDVKLFLPRKRSLSYSDLTAVFNVVQPTIDQEVRNLYTEAIEASKRLWFEFESNGKRVYSQTEN